MCEHVQLATEFSSVCVLCGNEEFRLANCTPRNVGFAVRHQRFQTGYNRENRFRKMVTQIIFPALSPINNAMIAYLFHQDIRNFEELLLAVKRAPIREKRFHALHAYSKAILNDWIFIEASFGLLLVEKICTRFRDLELRFHQQNETRGFINYRFLLHFMFDELKLYGLKRFVPKMKCKRRRTYYEELVKRLDNPIHVNTQ